jgi:hypothetical protein
MWSEPVQKLIRENAPADRISGLVGASHDRVRSWVEGAWAGEIANIKPDAAAAPATVTNETERPWGAQGPE